MDEKELKKYFTGEGFGDPLVVVEMSGNHNQSLDRAMAIVEAAAQAGARAVKLQTYTADTMTLDLNTKEFSVTDPKSLWTGNTLYSLYKRAYTPWEWHKPLFDRCKKLGMLGFSTPFDATAVDFLETLKVPCYKIASFENTDLPLIKKVAATGKPVIISTGMASLEELTECVETVRSAGCRDLILLKCTSMYPAPYSEVNLRTIPDLREKFKCPIGLSDHTMGNASSIAAVALGAVMIEKHLTLSRADKGVDSAFSIEPEELRVLIEDTARARKALGEIHYGPTTSERSSLQFRRSVYVVKDIQSGEVLTSENIRVIRPAYGLAPKHYSGLLGKKASRALTRGTALAQDMVK